MRFSDDDDAEDDVGGGCGGCGGRDERLDAEECGVRLEPDEGADAEECSAEPLVLSRRRADERGITEVDQNASWTSASGSWLELLDRRAGETAYQGNTSTV